MDYSITIFHTIQNNYITLLIRGCREIDSSNQLKVGGRSKTHLRPKIHSEKKKYKSPIENQISKILITTGDSYFKI